ncbi:MAG: Fic family protein [Nanoarchaeota archaeon]
MVSKYDVWYLLASKGEMKIAEIVKTLQKPHQYANIRKLTVQLLREGYVQKKDQTIAVVSTEETKKLYSLLSFCVKNRISYNFLFRKEVLGFISKAVHKEYFTREDFKIHGQTFNLYTEALFKYGFLLIISQKPLKCRLLRHHFVLELLSFFGKKVTFYEPHGYNYLPNIEKELKKYQRARTLQHNLFQDLEHKDEVKFIHMSLSLEGNPITLSDTERIVIKQVVPSEYKLLHVQEVTHYAQAVELMIQKAREKVVLTLPLILQYHRIAMAHLSRAGEWRRENVRILGNPAFKTSDWQLIPAKLKQLMKEYALFESQKRSLAEIIAFASFFHNEFQRIHPFIDGNSRISRLLMLHILRGHRLPVLDLPLGYFDEYMDLTKRSQKRDDEAFRQLVEELVFFNVRKINLIS